MKKTQKTTINYKHDFEMKIESNFYTHELSVIGFFCGNPNCSCKDMTLLFYKTSKKHKNSLFKLIINYETWSFVSIESYSDDIDCLKIAQDFMEQLTDKTKKEILACKQTKIFYEVDTLKEDINYPSFKADDMPRYFEIFHSSKNHLFAFEYEQKNYFVIDSYCANPKCKCLDVILEFSLIKNNRTVYPPKLVIRHSFKTKKYEIEHSSPDTSSELAKNLYQTFLDNFENEDINLLEERYYRIKKWGKDYLIPYLKQNQSSFFSPITAKKPKIGRNDPCFCGSGKKYKNCCGK